MKRKAKRLAAAMTAILFVLAAALPLEAADRVVQLNVPGCKS